jgi:cytochrome c-type biogenesis protein CcmH/NrfF
MVKPHLVKHLFVGVALALALGMVAPAAADPAADSSSWAYEAAAELMSPFCPGRTLADCPSPNAESLRLWLIVQAAAGRSRADVEEELYARYGDIMRPAPKAEGVGLTAYVIPVVAFVLGGLAITIFLRRNTTPVAALPRPAPAGAAPLDDAELERIVDEDIAR